MNFFMTDDLSRPLTAKELAERGLSERDLERAAKHAEDNPDPPYSLDGLTVGLLHHASIICNNKGEELSVNLSDGPTLRKALGCPLQAFHKEPAAVVLPVLKSAVRKLDKQTRQYLDQDEDSLEAEFGFDMSEDIKEIIKWATEFPFGLLEVCG